jgi:hypothetical protein
MWWVDGWNLKVKYAKIGLDKKNSQGTEDASVLMPVCLQEIRMLQRVRRRLRQEGSPELPQESGQ